MENEISLRTYAKILALRLGVCSPEIMTQMCYHLISTGIEREEKQRSLLNVMEHLLEVSNVFPHRGFVYCLSILKDFYQTR